jgi:succinate dehydrogenase / fumarate reductase cytochrome b subunit
MAELNRGDRPLSPHLSIYRRHFSMMTSILHRITGCGLALGGLLLVWWFLAAARGPENFALADGLLTSWIGGLILIASLVALWFHFFNGIRHLVWDAGAGFELDQVWTSGLVVIGATGVMTVITLIIGWV